MMCACTLHVDLSTILFYVFLRRLVLLLSPATFSVCFEEVSAIILTISSILTNVSYTISAAQNKAGLRICIEVVILGLVRATVMIRMYPRFFPSSVLLQFKSTTYFGSAINAQRHSIYR